MLVVGGGAVACELASIFAALDAQVTLVESRDRLLAFLDAEIADLLAAALTDIGVRILLGGGRPTIGVDGDAVTVTLGGGEVLRPDKVVVAAGRAGNTEDLGLDEAGVSTDDRGLIVVDEHFATSAPGIYAAGDVIGPPALASVSMEQGRAAACHAFGLPVRERVEAATPYGVYTIPEAAMVGLTEDAARDAGHDVVVGRARLSRNARTVINAGAGGLVKLVVDRTDGRLLGAHVLGDNATELIHQPQAVIHFGGGVDYFISATYNVPTASEAFKYAAYDALARIEDRPTLTTNV
jgi:NAD(P) transhydrogenase